MDLCEAGYVGVEWWKNGGRVWKVSVHRQMLRWVRWYRASR